jgi:hypothetical protein
MVSDKVYYLDHNSYASFTFVSLLKCEKVRLHSLWQPCDRNEP